MESYIASGIAAFITLVPLLAFIYQYNKDKRTRDVEETAKDEKSRNDIEFIKEKIEKIEKWQYESSAAQSEHTERIVRLEVKIEQLEKKVI